VVVVAEPTSPLPPAQVEAIRLYMTEPRADKKKGKLIVLAGAPVRPKGKVIRTGLEGLLLEFNVRLGDRVVVGRESKI